VNRRKVLVRRTPTGKWEKCCTDCTAWFALEMFHRDPRLRLGRENRCKLCRAGRRRSRAVSHDRMEA
jgi:hypothetical protein